MRNGILIFLLTAAMALLMAGCRRIEPASGEVGNLVLHFSTGEASTKAKLTDPQDTAPTDQQLLRDGAKFQNLLVIVTGKDDYIPVKWQYADNFGAATSTDFTFENLPLGTYRVFAFANIDHQDWIQIPEITKNTDDTYNESSIQNAVAYLCSGGVITNALDIERVLTLTSGTHPDYPAAPATPEGKATGMLLTGQQEVTVSISKNLGEVKLYRPVVRLKLVVMNHSGETVTLSSFSFSDINPSNAYLLGSDVNGTPSTPSTSYSSPTIIYTEEEKSLPNQKEIEKELLLFENAAPDDYRLNGNVVCGTVTKPVGNCRYHFKVEWDPGKRVTVTKTDDKAQKSNTNSPARSLRFGTSTVGLYTTSSTNPRLYEITLDLSSLVDFLSGTGFTILEGSKSWGKNGAANLEIGTPYVLKDGGTNGIPFTPTWSGSLLKAIDPNTHQVTPITYMRRNQEYTVALNIYKEVATGELSVTVDNSEWSDTAHESKHIFQ